MYYLYNFVLCCSSDLCAAYLDYSDALTQTLCALAAPTQLVAATDSPRPPPLKSQWWRSNFICPPSIVNLSTLPYLNQVHPTDQACQACPSKPFSKQHTKYCDPVPSFSPDYLPLQAIFEPTRHSLWAIPIITQQITFPSEPFSNRHAKRCDPVL